MNRAKLVSSLELLSHALAPADIVPIFQYFCFQDKSVYAFNDNLGIVADCDLDDEEFAVHGPTFRDLLKNSGAEEIEFDFEDETLVVTAGKGTFKLPCYSKDKFLFEIPNGKFDVSMPLDEALLKGLQVCLLTVSKAATQNKLMGVSVNANGKHISFYSCDGDAVTRFNTEFSAKGMKQDYMLPTAFCEAVIKIIGETEAELGKLEINSEWAKASLENGYTIYGRIEENDAFDFEGNIKSTMKGKQLPVAPPVELSDALSRARVLADPQGKPTMLQISKGRLALYTETHLGVCRDDLTIRGHADVKASVSAALLQRSLSACGKMAVHENCCVFTEDDSILIVAGNLNE